MPPAILVNDTRLIPIASLGPFPGNARVSDEAAIRDSYRRFGQYRSVVVNTRTSPWQVVAGWHLTSVMREEGAGEVLAGLIDVDEETATRINLADNRLPELGGFDERLLTDLLTSLAATDDGLAATGYSPADVEALLASLNPADPEPSGEPATTLRDRFLVPPFSVLDQRAGYWQDRKREWLALGIRSELGRGALPGGGDTVNQNGNSAWLNRGSDGPMRGTGRYGDEATEAVKRASPGGSPRPAARKVNGKFVRGDGAGRPIEIPGGRARSHHVMNPDHYREAAVDDSAAARKARPGGGSHHITDPGYYSKKQKAEAELGRALTNEEFDALAYKPLTLDSASGRDPRYYAQKAAVEKRLGHSITNPEFEADHYTPPEGAGVTATGTSVFDPVLCELAYRWFAPAGGTVLDPFSGGSVRGVVAAILGHPYTGLDLSAPQVSANHEQWREIAARAGHSGVQAAPASAYSADDLTPVEQHGDLWLKRDDLFEVNGANGGKARATLVMAQGADGLTGCGARQSPQPVRVARVAEHLGLPCAVYVSEGEETVEMAEAHDHGATVIAVPAGRMSVVKARCREGAAERGWKEIPFGAVSDTAVGLVAKQCENVPEGVKRVVVPLGSGTTLAGVLRGLQGRDVPILGVRVGGDPTKVLDAHAPADWRTRCEIVQATVPFEEHVEASVDGVVLDPAYEAKCVPFLKPGDLLWVVGSRSTVVQGERVLSAAAKPAPVWINGDSRTDLPDGPFDLLFSCPPYADLEVYSDNPADLSTMSYDEFSTAYREIIAAGVARLRPERAAVFVVGDVRDKRGAYRNFIGLTVDAFVQAGCSFLNEAILVSPVGSLPVRIGRQFGKARKLGKTHQNVLVFWKGDPTKVHASLGDVSIPRELLKAEDDTE